jgi:acetyl-CoA carboxylase/biotin carboxylase 1
VGYRSTGTVEFLFIEETQQYAFLELNPRLQVEHPVTENIFGVNLPSCQLMVAMGIPLHRIGDVRKVYGRNPFARDTIDFDMTEKVPLNRHCIAVRITAENPESGFQPTSGKITQLQFRSAIDVWGYFSVNSSGLIHEFADSQFGHLFAHGKDRDSARRAMIIALKELEIRGEIRTTIEYVIRLLQTEDFINNTIDTTWLDKRLARHAELVYQDRHMRPHANLVALCGASVKGFQLFEDARVNFMEKLRVGQIPAEDSIIQEQKIDLIYENVKYKLTCKVSGPNSVIISHCDNSIEVNIRQLADGGYLLDVNGKSLVVYAQTNAGFFRIILDGHTCIFTPEYDPTKLLSNVAGKLARLLVQDGEHLNAGDAYVEIEVMKMYMPLRVNESGVVRFRLSEGATLAPGEVIATMELDDSDRVVSAEVNIHIIVVIIDKLLMNCK